MALCALTGRERLQQLRSYPITSSTQATREGGVVVMVPGVVKGGLGEGAPAPYLTGLARMQRC